MPSKLNRFRQILRKVSLRLRQLVHVAKLIAGIIAATVVIYLAWTTGAANWPVFVQALEWLFA